MQALQKVPGVRLAAVCDVWDHHLRLARELADAKAFATKHYHELLARKDIDAVIIASPTVVAPMINFGVPEGNELRVDEIAECIEELEAAARPGRLRARLDGQALHRRRRPRHTGSPGAVRDRSHWPSSSPAAATGRSRRLR